jgi:uncharacterized membrane protein YjjP (DUF1212 family)
MIELITGTGAFGLMVLYEYQKCRNIRQNKTGSNPWFLLGLTVLLAAFAAEAVKGHASRGFLLAAGIAVLAAGLVFYGAVLDIARGKQGYTKDLMKTQHSMNLSKHISKIYQIL